MTRTIPFAKMQGVGNDFVVTDGREMSEGLVGKSHRTL